MRSGCAISWSCVLEFEAAAFSWMCAKRREEVGERGAKLTDLLCGREGEGGGEELGESVETVEGARGEFTPHCDLFEAGIRKGLDAVVGWHSPLDCMVGCPHGLLVS